MDLAVLGLDNLKGLFPWLTTWIHLCGSQSLSSPLMSSSISPHHHHCPTTNPTGLGFPFHQAPILSLLPWLDSPLPSDLYLSYPSPPPLPSHLISPFPSPELPHHHPSFSQCSVASAPAQHQHIINLFSNLWFPEVCNISQALLNACLQIFFLSNSCAIRCMIYVHVSLFLLASWLYASVNSQTLVQVSEFWDLFSWNIFLMINPSEYV